MITESPRLSPLPVSPRKFVQDRCSIVRAEHLTPELVRYIENVVWGFEKGVRYRILDRLPMLSRLLPPGFFLLLQRHGQLLGTLFCLPKHVSLGDDTSARAVYLSVLSVLPEVHGQGYAKRLVNAARLETPPGGLEYAYIEDLNVPSAAAFKAQGFEPIGQFHAITLNRLNPKRSLRAMPLPLTHAAFVKRLLSDLYQDHALADIESSFHPNQYWVLADQGKILAGAQVEEELWSITGMPGPDGWFAVNALPRLPLLNRVLNPRKIPLLKLGNLYVAPGQEQAFMELVEHLTRHYWKKLALVYLDKRSPVYQRLKKAAWFGCFNPLFETPVNIWARCQGIEASSVAALKKRPFVISPLDIS